MLIRSVSMAATCPECDSDIDIDATDVDIGDELSCSECGALLRVASDGPLELELADDDEDEDLDDEDEEEEEEDGEEEEEDEDWDEREDED
jgi:alpha-aminoadipate carrier protein LysW